MKKKFTRDDLVRLQELFKKEALTNRKVLNVDTYIEQANAKLREHIEIFEKQFNERLKSYLKANLYKFGHIFNFEYEFLDFCRRRIFHVSVEGKPYHFEFYIDYVSPEKKGLFVGSYNREPHFITTKDPYKWSIIIGSLSGEVGDPICYCGARLKNEFGDNRVSKICENGHEQ